MWENAGKTEQQNTDSSRTMGQFLFVCIYSIRVSYSLDQVSCVCNNNQALVDPSGVSPGISKYELLRSNLLNCSSDRRQREEPLIYSEQPLVASSHRCSHLSPDVQLHPVILSLTFLHTRFKTKLKL